MNPLITTALALALVSSLCCACARPLEKPVALPVNSQVVQVSSELKEQSYEDPRKAGVCSEAKKVSIILWMAMHDDFPNATTHVAACEIADQEAYWIVSVEERDKKGVLNRKVDVMYFLVEDKNSTTGWTLLRQEPVMQEGKFFDKRRARPFLPIPDTKEPESEPISL